MAVGYRVGARDERPGQEGLAHLLEHLMFRGSPGFPAGEIDRRAAELGGSVNAFTSHDQVILHWLLPGGDWRSVLEIEADRMRALALDPVSVCLEKEIVRSEIEASREDPWDRLEQLVLARLWGGHPYGRSVLGSPSALRRANPRALGDFHRRHLGPGRAVLALTGEFDPEEIRRALPSLFAPAERRPGVRPQWPLPRVPQRLVRSGRRGVEGAPRALLALPVLAASAAELSGLEVLAGLLAWGRSSRLVERLVEREGLASWVDVELLEGDLGSAFLVVAELVEGAAPPEWERVVFEELGRLRHGIFDREDLARTRAQFVQRLRASLERTLDRALARVQAALRWRDPWIPERQLERAAIWQPRHLKRLARRWLDPERGGVLGWSLP